MLFAGAARSVITPPTGITMAGYAARDGVAQGTESDLYATALVLCDDQTCIAIVAFDLLFLQEPLASAIRLLISQRLGIPHSNVLLNCSHTHCGPTFETFCYDDDKELTQLRKAYESRLQIQIPALVVQAKDYMKRARIGTGVGEARIGINRRERQADGSFLLGENPSGPVDHEVRVIRIDNLEGKPIVTVFAHGCHTVTMGPKCLRWSSDYIGPARQLIEQNTGSLSLFLQANAGDINPVVGIGSSEDDSDAKNRTGLVLGSEVLKVHSLIYTESVRGPKVLIGSLSKIPFYPRVPVNEESDQVIQVQEQLLDLSFVNLPSREIAQDILSKWESEVATLVDAKTRGGALNAAQLFLHWARVLVNYVASGSRAKIQIPVQAIRIHDLAIVTVPAETFSEQGMRIKQASPFRKTLALGYSNGCVGYVPTQDAYPESGWSIAERYYVPDMIFQGYALPSALAPDSSGRIVQKSLEMLGRF